MRNQVSPSAAGYSRHRNSRASSSLAPSRNASTNAALTYVRPTVSSGIAPTPGSRNSGSMARSRSYSGSGNSGVAVSPAGTVPAANGSPGVVIRSASFADRAAPGASAERISAVAPASSSWPTTGT